MITFNICDGHMALEDGNWCGQRIRVFRKQLEDLPVPQVGDYIILKSLRVWR